MGDFLMASPYTQPFMERVLDGDKGTQLMTDEEMASLNKWQPKARADNKGRFPQTESVQETPPTPEVLDDSRVGPSSSPSGVENPVTPSLTPSWGGSPATAAPSATTPTADEEADLPTPRHSSRDKSPAVSATVSRVIDGDTFVANVGGKQTIVRISGIDTEEPGPGGRGEAAKEMLTKLLANGNVQVSIVGEDNFGRKVAKVKVGETDIGAFMTRSGLAHRWLGQPEGWPHGNELRSLRKQMDVDDQIRLTKLEGWYRRFGLMATKNARPTAQQLDDAMREAGYFQKKYPGFNTKKSAQSGGLGPETEAAIGISPTMPGASSASTPTQKWEDVAVSHNRPQGKREWSAWEKTLWPPEMALWRKLQASADYYQKNAPPTGRAKYFSSPEFVRFRKLYEKFLDKTTKRWRDLPPPPPNQGGRGHRRRRRADLEPNTLDALDAVA